MNLCEKCGTQVQDGQNFCASCGTKIQPKATQSFCHNCGNQLQPNQVFCNICGTRIQQMNSFCPKCGMQLQPGQNFCMRCNGQVGNTGFVGNIGQSGYSGNANPAENTAQSVNVKKKSNGYIPAFVLGLIGSIFGLLGGICVSACYSFGGNDAVPMIMLIGGSLIGMLGACIGFKFARSGAILEITGTLLMAICAFTITGADIMTLLAIAMMGISGIIALIMSFVGD